MFQPVEAGSLPGFAVAGLAVATREGALVNQHLGAELSKYLDFTIVHMDGKAVGIVVCQPSNEPAFLKSVKKEAFYIRNGPSSEELPVSKVLTYIQNRK